MKKRLLLIWTCVPVLGGGALLGRAEPAAAQAMPGGHPRDHADRHLRRRMEYRSERLTELDRLMSDWREAWVDDDAGRRSELYTEDGVLSPPGDAPTAHGREAIEGLFDGLLEECGGIETNLADFDVSEGLAYTMGSFSYPVSTAQGARRTGEVRGTLVTVFRQEGRDWRIRSQLLEASD
ncbi:MAG: YybH family protein [Gemmatimonadota bacterium]